MPPGMKSSRPARPIAHGPVAPPGCGTIPSREPMPITHTASSHQSLMPIAPRLAASRHADAIVGPTRPQSAMPIASRPQRIH